MKSKFLLRGTKCSIFFSHFSQDFQDFGRSYLWNGNRYQQTVKSFLFGFQWSFILANKKLSNISMQKHFKAKQLARFLYPIQARESFGSPLKSLSIPLRVFELTLRNLRTLLQFDVKVGETQKFRNWQE